MDPNRFLVLAAVGLAGLAAGCARWSGERGASAVQSNAVFRAIQDVKAKYAPDNHLGIYTVGIQQRAGRLVLTGEVTSVQARLDTLEAARRAGAKARDQIVVLPSAELGEQVWGISCLSVASAREQPEHKAELGTQILLGDVVRVWKRTTNAIFTWYLVQSADDYPAWLEAGTFVRCTKAEVDAWQNSPLLIVTALEDRVLAQPQTNAEPVGDVVIADRLKPIGESGDWYQVELPDHRMGFLPKESAEDYAAWKRSRQPTAENLERTGRRLLGRPYLWGANSPKGLDCSGFTKLVFLLNGVDLLRNASHQSRQGTEVPLDPDLTQLRKGDLLFFGRRPRGAAPERVTHVGIYLGDKLFLHSSERVRLSSLDPASPLRDEFRIRTLLRARRVLP